VEGTVQEFAKAMQAKAEGEGEISDDDAEAVAGGSLWAAIVAFFSGK
jgi:hypothetical protein